MTEDWRQLWNSRKRKTNEDGTDSTEIEKAVKSLKADAGGNLAQEAKAVYEHHSQEERMGRGCLVGQERMQRNYC